MSIYGVPNIFLPFFFHCTCIERPRETKTCQLMLKHTLKSLSPESVAQERFLGTLTWMIHAPLRHHQDSRKKAVCLLSKVYFQHPWKKPA